MTVMLEYIFFIKDMAPKPAEKERDSLEDQFETMKVVILLRIINFW